MSVYLIFLGAVCMPALAAPPQSLQGRVHSQYPGPAYLQQQQLSNYFEENPEVVNYYNQQAQQKQEANANPNAPSRLESLEPDSEVEILPGGIQPQQPPQQSPAQPNIPGLAPGQRVYIIHMPIPGYRPGTLGGYQPVYVVAAAPGGNPSYAQVPGGNPNYAQGPVGNPNYAQGPVGNPNYVQGGNPGYQAGNPGYVQVAGGNPNYVQSGYQGVQGYQNAILVDPSSGQPIYSPYPGYQRVGLQGNPGFVLGQPQLAGYNLVQDPRYGFQPIPNPNAAPASPGTDARGSLRLAQLVSLQMQPHVQANPQASKEKSNLSSPSRVGEASGAEESKEEVVETKRNARPTPAHVVIQRGKNKA